MPHVSNGMSDGVNNGGMSRGGAVPHSAAIGTAFGIDDALLALRWAKVVRSRGYRLTFSHAFVGADEAIQVHRVGHARLGEAPAVVTLFLGVHWVWVVDAAGRTTPFADLAAALLSLVELSPPERRAVLAPCTPAWLWTFRPPRPAASAWHHALLAALTRWLSPRRSGHTPHSPNRPGGQDG